ncbi:PD40 domain-containing protein [bacterium]|nr:PD40 domain-containing protein [bacterium]
MKKQSVKRSIFQILLCIIAWCRLAAQPQLYNHPELKWWTIETDHFFVHYHEGAERSASLTAKIAEEIYQPITSLYHYEPGEKMHFVVRDHADESNGASYYYDNKVEIWAPAADFLLRGSHNWLRNVITHEFSHMISLGAARKMPRQIPAIYFQYLGYEKERRPDVLHGYPNTIVSFPFAGTVIPPWFAEGMAQFQRAGLDYDTWDTHRDMVLRMAVLEGELLSLNEMAHFDKNSLGNERVYNQGYGLTLYMVQRYGEEVVRELVQAMKQPLQMDFSGAVRKVLNLSESELYDEWVVWLRDHYCAGIDLVQQSLFVGKIIQEKGSGNFYPVISPDGSRMAFLSNRGMDYLSQTGLWIADLQSGKSRKITSGVTSSLSWSPNGNQLVYAKRTDRTTQGSYYYDLYRYDLGKDEEKRMTYSLRARHPDWSRDNQRLVCVVEQDGTSNLVIVDTDGQNIHPITSFQNGEEIFSPRWFDQDRKILFAFSEDGEGRDIAVIDSSGSCFQYVLKTENDERDPFPGDDGNVIYFSSDRTGIFNLYQLEYTSGKIAQLTNVLGGAFMPAVSREGQLVYSLFTAEGYHLAQIDTLEKIAPQTAVYSSPYDGLRTRSVSEKWDIAGYDDRDVVDYPSRPYKPIYSKIMFLPRIMFDYPRKMKIGLYLYGSDYLDKISILGSVAVNELFDTDIFGFFEYRRFYPTLFIEAYQQTRHKTIEEIDAEFKLRYNLMEVDIGADWRLSPSSVLRTAFIYSRYSYSGSGEFVYQNVFGKFTSVYHRGRVLQLRLSHRSIPSTLNSEIAPNHGRDITLQFERAWQSYGDSAGVSEKHGTPIDIYSSYGYEQIQLDWREYLPSVWKSHSMMFRLRAGLIDQPVASFYHFFAGGLDGLKGYPYYSLEGRKLLHLGLAYRFPLFQKMELRVWFVHLHRLFLSLYCDAGDAWSEGGLRLSRWKKDVGAQLRLTLTTFYTYPMSLFIDAAYGMDRFTHRDQEYGLEWRTYFGILFQFLD